jgi:class 3 adenylate cyclase
MYAAREALGQTFWKVRVGIHTGPVVSGVVGTKKFAFDVWGDSVNLASRMESNGVVNRVNVSQATFEAAREQFRFEPRGPINVKGQGEVHMYLVKGRR